MVQLTSSSWLFIGINLLGWAFSAGVLITTVLFIRERIKAGDEKFKEHDRQIDQVDGRVTVLEVEHRHFHHESKGGI